MPSVLKSQGSVIQIADYVDRDTHEDEGIFIPTPDLFQSDDVLHERSAVNTHISSLIAQKLGVSEMEGKLLFDTAEDVTQQKNISGLQASLRTKMFQWDEDIYYIRIFQKQGKFPQITISEVR